MAIRRMSEILSGEFCSVLSSNANTLASETKRDDCSPMRVRTYRAAKSSIPIAVYSLDKEERPMTNNRRLSLMATCVLFGFSVGCKNSRIAEPRVGLAERNGATAQEQVSTRSGARSGVPADPSAFGYLNLHGRHPDGKAGVDEFVEEYSVDHALQRLEQINGFLASFRTLTNRVRSRRIVTDADLDTIGNTDGDMQTIGFHNIPLIVEGTVLKQEYKLKQLEYGLARVKYDRGEITASDLERAKQEYEQATNRFQTFWDTKLPTD